MDPVTAKRPTRRERLRNATVAEIKDVARSQLAASGPLGVSLRAIARDMGMSAPALYRYFPSLEALITELCVDLFDELGESMVAACDTLPEKDLLGRIVVAARAFRHWAVSHKPEFSLMFASQVPGASKHGPGGRPTPEEEPYAAQLRFSRIFGTLFNDIHHQSEEDRGFPLTTPVIPPLNDALREEILQCMWLIGAEVPIEYAFVFHSYWVRLYGFIAMEVFSQLPVVENAEALFDAELSDMAHRLGVDLGY